MSIFSVINLSFFFVYSQRGRLGFHHRAVGCDGGTGRPCEAGLRGEERLWYAEYTLANGRWSAGHVYWGQLSVIYDASLLEEISPVAAILTIQILTERIPDFIFVDHS